MDTGPSHRNELFGEVLTPAKYASYVKNNAVGKAGVWVYMAEEGGRLAGNIANTDC